MTLGDDVKIRGSSRVLKVLPCVMPNMAHVLGARVHEWLLETAIQWEE